MASTTSDHYNYELATTSTPCNTLLDPNLSAVRSFRTRQSFWSPNVTEAMVFRDEKFKAYKYGTLSKPAPRFNAHYEDHFTAGLRKPRYPVRTRVVEQPQPHKQLRPFEAEFSKWFIIILLLIMTLGLLKFVASFLSLDLTLVVMGMASFGIVAFAHKWLATRDTLKI
ncbi:hypothetical protein IFR05_003065 [Cadophora sp. M221]|nr:hypothetical protein IFR05_003065 [Cadophora sp. M221]